MKVKRFLSYVGVFGILTSVGLSQWSYATGSSNTTVSGSVQVVMVDVNVPSINPDLVVDPNLPDGSAAPEFSIENNSNSPLRLGLRVFEQTTNTFNDVLPDKYDSWEGLSKAQSKDLALGLVAKEGEGWQSIVTPASYAATHTDCVLGVIKPKSTVAFNFDIHHGKAFDEAATFQYRMVFVFDLLGR